MSTKSRKNYSREFKQEAVRLITEKDYSIAEASRLCTPMVKVSNSGTQKVDQPEKRIRGWAVGLDSANREPLQVRRRGASEFVT